MLGHGMSARRRQVLGQGRKVPGLRVQGPGSACRVQGAGCMVWGRVRYIMALSKVRFTSSANPSDFLYPRDARFFFTC